jgi:hypothetical protein
MTAMLDSARDETHSAACLPVYDCILYHVCIIASPWTDVQCSMMLRSSPVHLRGCLQSILTSTSSFTPFCLPARGSSTPQIPV